MASGEGATDAGDGREDGAPTPMLLFVFELAVVVVAVVVDTDDDVPLRAA